MAAGYPADEIPRRIREKFLDQMCTGDRDPHFFVGNTKKYLQTFMVLGVFWPKLSPAEPEALF